MVISSPGWIGCRACTVIKWRFSSHVMEAFGRQELLNLARCRNTPYSRMLSSDVVPPPDIRAAAGDVRAVAAAAAAPVLEPLLMRMGATGARGRQLELKIPRIGSMCSPKALCKLR
jgi:hypothetical protein